MCIMQCLNLGWCSIMPWSQPRLWVAPLPQTTTISGREDTKETLTIWRKEGRTMILSRGPQQSLPDTHSHCWLLRKCWLSLPPQPSLRMRLCRCSRQLLKARSLLPLSHLFNVLLSVSILTWVGRLFIFSVFFVCFHVFRTSVCNFLSLPRETCIIWFQHFANIVNQIEIIMGGLWEC